MKITKTQSQNNRAHIVATASALFRERGFDGVGVAELMAAAGFTQGGFYKHFGSKADLMAEAAANGLAQSLASSVEMEAGSFSRFTCPGSTAIIAAAGARWRRCVQTLRVNQGPSRKPLPTAWKTRCKRWRQSTTRRRTSHSKTCARKCSTGWPMPLAQSCYRGRARMIPLWLMKCLRFAARRLRHHCRNPVRITSRRFDGG